MSGTDSACCYAMFGTDIGQLWCAFAVRCPVLKLRFCAFATRCAALTAGCCACVMCSSDMGCAGAHLVCNVRD
eukprot:3314596-Rhodomonas_salina.3